MGALTLHPQRKVSKKRGRGVHFTAHCHHYLPFLPMTIIMETEMSIWWNHSLCSQISLPSVCVFARVCVCVCVFRSVLWKYVCEHAGVHFTSEFMRFFLDAFLRFFCAYLCFNVVHVYLCVCVCVSVHEREWWWWWGNRVKDSPQLSALIGSDKVI